MIKFIVTRIAHNRKCFTIYKNGHIVGECYARMSAVNAVGNITHLRKVRPYNDPKLLKYSIYITWLSIECGHRKKYYGTRLLYYVFKCAYRKGYKYVTLCDGSAKTGSNDSIYRTIGLEYIPDSDGYVMDMVGNLRHILYGKFRGKNGYNTDNMRFYRNRWIKTYS